MFPNKLVFKCFLSKEWTRDHYVLARGLMQRGKIEFLRPDLREDVIQDIALKYANEIGRFRGTTPEQWLRWFSTQLFNRSVDLSRRENFIRGHEPKDDQLKQFVDVEELELDSALSEDFCKEWMDLVVRATSPEDELPEVLVRRVAEHCCDCRRCACLLWFLIDLRVQLLRGRRRYRFFREIVQIVRKWPADFVLMRLKDNPSLWECEPRLIKYFREEIMRRRSLRDSFYQSAAVSSMTDPS